MRRLLLLATVPLIVACGGKKDSPTAPSPQVAQVGGVWTGTATLTSASGGECVGALYQAIVVGRSTGYTVAITQVGSNLTATVTSQETGIACSYTGTAGANTVSLNATSCQAALQRGIRCANGASRDMELVAAGITATVAGNTATGTAAETWNVRVAGGSSGVGIMTLGSTFRMTR